LYTSNKSGKETYEEDVVHIATASTGKLLEKGKYAITISGNMILGRVQGGHPMNVGAKVTRDLF
jgi:hypothetical protein